MGRASQEGLENMGKSWKQEEIDQLLNEIKQKKTFEEIAEIHKRSEGGISSRLRDIAGKLHLNENKTIQECIEITGLEKSDIIDAISRRRAYNSRTLLKMNSKQQGISVPQRPVDSVSELRKDLNELKKDVKEILRLMNALYDFENQED